MRVNVKRSAIGFNLLPLFPFLSCENTFGGNCFVSPQRMSGEPALYGIKSYLLGRAPASSIAVMVDCLRYIQPQPLEFARVVVQNMPSAAAIVTLQAQRISLERLSRIPSSRFD